MSLNLLQTPPTTVDVYKLRCAIAQEVFDTVEAKKYNLQSCVKSANLQRARLWVLNSECTEICPPPEIPKDPNPECTTIKTKPIINKI